MAQKILFIEDESALQRAVAKTLGEEGYELIQAIDGETGVRLAKSEDPQLILLDLILPKKDGFQILRELKEMPETKNIPVVILTNLEGATDIQRALELGATTYLVKTSHRLEDVTAKVKELLK